MPRYPTSATVDFAFDAPIRSWARRQLMDRSDAIFVVEVADVVDANGTSGKGALTFDLAGERLDRQATLWLDVGPGKKPVLLAESPVAHTRLDFDPEDPTLSTLVLSSTTASFAHRIVPVGLAGASAGSGSSGRSAERVYAAALAVASLAVACQEEPKLQ